MLNVRLEGMLMAFQSHIQPCKTPMAYFLRFDHFRIDTFSEQKRPRSRETVKVLKNRAFSELGGGSNGLSSSTTNGLVSNVERAI